MLVERGLYLDNLDVLSFISADSNAESLSLTGVEASGGGHIDFK